MNIEMKEKLFFVELVFALLLNITPLFSTDLKSLQNITGDYAMQNVMERNCLSLNGEWDVMVDPSMLGEKKKWWKIRTPKNNHDFLELKYEGNYRLKVPGDWNHQYPEFFYYRGNMWYKRDFTYKVESGRRLFLHFGAVSQHCSVYLNGEPIGKHEGGYTPFQIEVTGKIKNGKNYLIVRVDNCVTEKTIPALQFDWCNYGGITRDVNLVSVPETYIRDYFVQLCQDDEKHLQVHIRLDGPSCAGRKVTLSIPETSFKKDIITDASGTASAIFKSKFELWSPENPKLYEVNISTASDTVADRIGFRTVRVQGEDILLNGKPVFLSGINIHEEIASVRRRACTPADARYLLGEAKSLGCNFVRLAHYPQNEYMVRLAEEMGFLMWEEIPVWQNISLNDPNVRRRGETMLNEMISRDKNRCGIIIWSVSNETFPSAKGRLEALAGFVNTVRNHDNTRLVSSALHGAKAVKDGDRYVMRLDDPLIEYLDVVGNNKYMGWYEPFPCDGKDLHWEIGLGKPLIMSEFGAEAVYGNDIDSLSVNSWSETYMEWVYKEDIKSFSNARNLRGTSPWILFDFLSPGRSNSLYQKGWNLKGLISPKGKRKKAWYIMHDYYEE